MVKKGNALKGISTPLEDGTWKTSRGKCLHSTSTEAGGSPEQRLCMEQRGAAALKSWMWEDGLWQQGLAALWALRWPQELFCVTLSSEVQARSPSQMLIHTIMEFHRGNLGRSFTVVEITFWLGIFFFLVACQWSLILSAPLLIVSTRYFWKIWSQISILLKLGWMEEEFREKNLS